MDRLQRGYYRVAAELKYLKLKRQEFQTWVGEILKASLLGDYENIRLTQGDGGLDGIIFSRSAVVAVNAPREQTASTLQKKIESDFSKAMKTMAERGVKLGGFIFVHNDEGLTKDVGPALLKLRQDNDVDVECWTFERLWQEIETLDETKLAEMFGDGPSISNVEQLQMPAVREVIVYLTGVAVASPPLGSLEIPDPKKLEYNELSQEVQDMLKVGRTKHALVADYLSGTTDFQAGESIAEAFRGKYAAAKEAGMDPDSIFGVLWNFAGGNHFTSPTQYAAVTSILSYFFHACDIFENVPENQ